MLACFFQNLNIWFIKWLEWHYCIQCHNTMIYSLFCKIYLSKCLYLPSSVKESREREMWCGSVDRSTRVCQQVCKQTWRGRCWSCCLPSWGFAEGTEYVPWRNICIPIISPETASFTDRPVFLLWCGLQILAISAESCGPLSRVGWLAEHAPISLHHACKSAFMDVWGNNNN